MDFTELEEALVLVKQKKQKEIKQPEFLQKVDEEMDKGTCMAGVSCFPLCVCV